MRLNGFNDGWVSLSGGTVYSKDSFKKRPQASFSNEITVTVHCTTNTSTVVTLLLLCFIRNVQHVVWGW